MSLEKYEACLEAIKELIAAERTSLKSCEAMRQAPIGISRAKSTTLNAKWTSAAEQRDRVLHKAHVAVVRAALAGRFEDSYYGSHPTGHKWCQILVERERP